MKISRDRYKKSTNRWPAATEFYASGRYRYENNIFTVYGLGPTPQKAKLDLLYMQGRRRTTWYPTRKRR